MIWTSLLLSVSGYTWYLIFLSTQDQVYPVSLVGFAGMFFISIVPTILGFALNDFLLSFKPMIIKIIVVNLLLLLLLVSITSWYSGFWEGVPFFHSGGMNSSHSLFFPAFWQFLSWSCGTYLLLSSKLRSDQDHLSHTGVLWISLLLVFPSVFLLNFMNLPLMPLMGIISCWFFLMALSLALEGIVSARMGSTRYDIIFIHALVPMLAAFLIYFTAFSRDIRELLIGAMNMLLFLLGLLLRLLNFLFAGVPEADPAELSGYGLSYMEERAVERVVEIPSWVFLLVLVPVLLFLFIKIVPVLLRWLRSRLEIERTGLKRQSLSPLKTLLLVWHWFVWLLKNLIKGLLLVIIGCKKTTIKYYGKIKRMWRRWLPARTPYEKILRSYESFLKWGRRSGCLRKPGETPREYACRLQGLSREAIFLHHEIIRITDLFQEARYSNHPVTYQQGDDCQESLRKIRVF